MIVWSFALLSALAPVPDDAAKQELAALAKKVVDAQRYVFEYSTSSTQEEAAKPEEGADAPEAEKPAERGDPWKVDFDRARPLHYVHGRSNAWVGERKLVYLDGRGRWSPLDRSDEPRSKVSAGGGGGVKVDRGDRRAQHLFDDVERIPLPHELLAGLAERIADVTREETKEGGVVYVATLTPIGARDFAGIKPPKARHVASGESSTSTKGDGSAPAPAQKVPECSGVVRFTVAAGAIVAIDADVQVKATKERRIDRRFRLSGLDAEQPALPPEVSAAFGLK